MSGACAWVLFLDKLCWMMGMEWQKFSKQKWSIGGYFECGSIVTVLKLIAIKYQRFSPSFSSSSAVDEVNLSFRSPVGAILDRKLPGL